jgi:hypothetical protein
MDADLDLLLIAVYCTVDDPLPKRAGNARRRISDAELITLCIAQAMMGIPSDPRFLAVAGKRLGHLFPHLPERTAFHKRRLRLSGVIEALIAEFAKHSPGFFDDLLLVDSTPVECARSRETVKRGGQSSLADALADAADYGYCASHSRFFWGFRLHALFALDGTPRALALTSPKIDEKLVCLQLVERCERRPGRQPDSPPDGEKTHKMVRVLVRSGREACRVGPSRRSSECPSRRRAAGCATGGCRPTVRPRGG